MTTLTIPIQPESYPIVDQYKVGIYFQINGISYFFDECIADCSVIDNTLTQIFRYDVKVTPEQAASWTDDYAFGMAIAENVGLNPLTFDPYKAKVLPTT